MYTLHLTLFNFLSHNPESEGPLASALANEGSEAQTGPLLAQVTPLGNGRVSPKGSGSRARGCRTIRAGV